MCDRKSRILTYLLSLIGGIFGLHHLYLGRTQHALLWFTTLGGFGIGLIYEILFLIPKYVGEANHDRFVVQLYKLQMLRKKSPAFEIFRLCGKKKLTESAASGRWKERLLFQRGRELAHQWTWLFSIYVFLMLLLGQYLTAVVYGFITCYAFPDTWHGQPSTSLFVGVCTATAIGVGTVDRLCQTVEIMISLPIGTKLAGTLGPRRCSLLWPWFGAMLGLPFLIRRADSSSSFNIPALLSSLFFEWRVEWNREYFPSASVDKVTESQSSMAAKQPRRRRRHFVQRCLLFGLGALIFTGIFTSAIYQNFQVQINGQPVKVKDVLTNFFKSQEFIRLSQQLGSVMRRLWHFYLQYGLKGIWTQIWTALDLENDKQAFGVSEAKIIEWAMFMLKTLSVMICGVQVLNLTSNASQKAIEAQCRTLSRQWHPDRYRVCCLNQMDFIIVCFRLGFRSETKSSNHFYEYSTSVWSSVRWTETSTIHQCTKTRKSSLKWRFSLPVSSWTSLSHSFRIY